jgi:hypothetical protein
MHPGRFGCTIDRITRCVGWKTNRIFLSLAFFSEPPFIIRQAEVQGYQFLLAELRARLAYQLQNKLNFWLNYARHDSTIALHEL